MLIDSGSRTRHCNSKGSRQLLATSGASAQLPFGALASERAVPRVCVGVFVRAHLNVRANSVQRTGMTLVELLVVLVLMAIAAAIVAPSLRLPGANALISNANTTRSPVDAILTDARRLAMRRGQPLRLRVAADGVWAIVPLEGGATVKDGRVNGSLTWLPDVRVDSMGSCLLEANVVPPANARSWDALACRWIEAAS